MKLNGSGATGWFTDGDGARRFVVRGQLVGARNPSVKLGSSEVLSMMNMQVTLRVPRKTVWVVTFRLWLACRLAKLAALVGGCQINYVADEAWDADQDADA